MKAIGRVMEILKAKGIKPFTVETDLSFSNGYLATMFKRDGYLGEEALIKLSEYLKYSLNYLLTGKEVNYLDGINEEAFISKEPNEEYKLLKKHVLPLIPLDAMAGYANGDAQVMEYESENFIIPTFKGSDFLISVRGSSMYPKYNSGDIVACKRLELDAFFQWNKVYVLDTKQGALIKRVRKGKDDEHVLIVSENPKYEPFELNRNEIYALAMVTGVIRLE